MIKKVYCLEGIDRLGKSTLINGILNQLGYYQVIPFGKPKLLDCYSMSLGSVAIERYQRTSFYNSMLLAKSGANIIFDRWHLGEAVYAPLYRGYDGNYVFTMEKDFQLDLYKNIRLILLTENFDIASHFISDGNSVGPDNARSVEQQLFLNAFERSIIPDKRVICVTDPTTGEFKSKEWVLQEALA